MPYRATIVECQFIQDDVRKLLVLGFKPIVGVFTFFLQLGKLLIVELIQGEWESEVIISYGDKLLIRDDGLVYGGFKLVDKDLQGPAHKSLHIMQMKLMLPAWGGQFIDLIYKLKEVNNSISFDIRVILIHKEIDLFLLLDYTQDNALKVLPTQPDINLRELLHPSQKLNVSDIVFDSGVVGA